MSSPHYLANTNLPPQGFCNACDSNTLFSVPAVFSDFREQYKCTRCGSVPRERSLMMAIEKFFPAWRNMSVHESSPGNRGASLKLAQAPGYTCSQYWPDAAPGELRNGIRNENLERLTWPDATFDLFVTQDVMEHVFDPRSAFREIARVLKPSGAHVFTVPLVNEWSPSEVAATRDAEGNITYHRPAEYHGNPVAEEGSLVVMQWGYDIVDAISSWTGMTTTIFHADNVQLGIRAEYIEVLVCRKK